VSRVGARFALLGMMVGAVCSVASAAVAQVPEPSLHANIPTKEVGESLRMTMSSGAPNQYFFRGMLQSDKGFIWQSSANLDVALYDSESFRFITPVTFGFSLHLGDQAETGRGPRAWYESRLGGGIALEGPSYRADLRFVVYSSPNGTFHDVYELNLRLSLYDDVLWAPQNPNAVFRGLFPSVFVAQEVKGARDGVDPGLFVELGVAPRIRLFNSEAITIDGALPIAAGLGHRYYQLVERGASAPTDHVLGYISGSLFFDVALKFLPKSLGLCNAEPSVTLLLPSAAKGAQDRVDSAEVVFKIDGVLRF
jgi:hypothetical protein